MSKQTLSIGETHIFICPVKPQWHSALETFLWWLKICKHNLESEFQIHSSNFLFECLCKCLVIVVDARPEVYERCSGSKGSTNLEERRSSKSRFAALPRRGQHRKIYNMSSELRDTICWGRNAMQQWGGSNKTATGSNIILRNSECTVFPVIYPS